MTHVTRALVEWGWNRQEAENDGLLFGVMTTKRCDIDDAIVFVEQRRPGSISLVGETINRISHKPDRLLGRRVKRKP